MKLRQRQLGLVFGLVSSLLAACGSDAAKSGSTNPASAAGSVSETAGSAGSGGSDAVTDGGSAGDDDGNRALGGAQAPGGASSGPKTGTVKLILKVK